MAKRSVDWNQGLAEDLRDLKFSQNFIQAALDEGLSLQSALGKVIRLYGLKEFAKKSGVSGPNILRAIGAKGNPTIETLNRLLKPFSLQLSVAPRVRMKAA